MFHRRYYRHGRGPAASLFLVAWPDRGIRRRLSELRVQGRDQRRPESMAICGRINAEQIDKVVAASTNNTSILLKYDFMGNAINDISRRHI